MWRWRHISVRLELHLQLQGKPLLIISTNTPMSQTNPPMSSRSLSIPSDREVGPTYSTHHTRRGLPRSKSASSDEFDQPPHRGRVSVDDLPVDQAEYTGRAVTKADTDAIDDKVGDTAGQVAGNDDEEGAISLRLDLNLDVYVKLKAKVHGDITLQLL